MTTGSDDRARAETPYSIALHASYNQFMLYYTTIDMSESQGGGQLEPWLVAVEMH